MKDQLYGIAILILLGTAGIVVFQPGLIKHAADRAGIGNNKRAITNDGIPLSTYSSSDIEHVSPSVEQNQSFSSDFSPPEDLQNDYVYIQAPRTELTPETEGVDLIDIPEFSVDTIPDYSDTTMQVASVEAVSDIPDYGFDDVAIVFPEEHEDAFPTDSETNYVAPPEADFSVFDQPSLLEPEPKPEIRQPDQRYAEFALVGSAVPNYPDPIVQPPQIEPTESIFYDPNSTENRNSAGPIAVQTKPIASPPTGEQSNTAPMLDLPPNNNAESQPGRFHIDPNMVEIVPVPGALTLARVGNEIILGCDVYPEAKKRIYLDIKENLKKVPPEDRAKITDEEIEDHKQKMLVQYFPHILEQQIQMTLLYCDFTHGRKKEDIASIERKIGDGFDDKELPNLIKTFEVKNRQELNRILEKEIGSSIDREKALFVRNMLAYSWMSEQIREATGECNHDEMLWYYESHLAEFEHKAKSKWFQLTVATSQTMSPEEAKKKLIWMANQVVSGVPFNEIAMKYSDGPTAKTGGAWDWTGKGVLVSTELENAIFQTPVGNISPIIEDQIGVHIVKVVERVDQSYTPFTEAQTKIREKIKELRRQKKEVEYLAELNRKFQPEIYIDSPTPLDPQNTRIVLPESNGKSLHWHR